MIYKIYAGSPCEEQLVQQVYFDDLIKAKKHFRFLVHRYRWLRSFIMKDDDGRIVCAEMQA